MVTLDDGTTRECLDAVGVMRCMQIMDDYACARAGAGVVKTRA